MSTKKYVLLDRDGTIIVNKHYQKDPDQTELLPNAAAGLHKMRDAGFGLVIITNQSGIGRGFLTKTDLASVNRRMIMDIDGRDDFFAGIYYCPHTPEAQCHCRKPKPGMVELAAAELKFAPPEAYVIGDSYADIQTGNAVGATTVLVLTGNGRETEQITDLDVDYIATDLVDAANWVIRREKWMEKVTSFRVKKTAGKPAETAGKNADLNGGRINGAFRREFPEGAAIPYVLPAAF